MQQPLGLPLKQSLCMIRGLWPCEDRGALTLNLNKNDDVVACVLQTLYPGGKASGFHRIEDG